jgi:hypothetical protein
MRSNASVWIPVALWLAAASAANTQEVAQAQSEEQTKAPEVEETELERPAPVYKNPTAEAVRYQPPRRGAPRSKIGGGARTGLDWPLPLTLAPDHVAHTISATPDLLWYIESLPPDGARVVITIHDGVSVKPLLEKELRSPERAGIQRVRLSRLGVELAPEVEYEWSIALVRDPNARSKDLISTAYILRVAPPRTLGTPSVARYAELGLWYDALAAAYSEVTARPDDPAAQGALDSLLRQANLTEPLP